ncbi:MAG: hypothetical protein NZ924_05210 [Candidatus Bipolaricaulota bacterium]|nr:hypothetical protein [Candidatus Bipolaricaulota bacterium]MDW8152288.1 SpoIVB peptidase S55 domain-containing protein [Candidatus Bipolaricaulota bacterium]
MRWVLGVLAAGWAVWVGLGVEIIPLREIRPGMVGYGLTVVRGTEIVRFEVEVVDVLDEPGERHDFLVVRAFGEAIQRSGGIAAGMSGSPVYFEGRLAGALSRAAAWSLDRTKPLGLVTPIESMLKLLAELDEEEVPLPREGNLRALGIERLLLVAAPPETIPEGALVAWPLAAPVMVSGLSPRTLALLRDGVDLRALAHPLQELLLAGRGRLAGLRELGLSQVFAAPAVGSATPMEFAPGAPVGVALALGDLTVGALGTVTLVDGPKVLAFGHPFLFAGSPRYFLTGATVLDTVAAYDISYKFGSLAELRGGVFADRWAGVGGRTDRVPLGLDVAIEVRGEGQGRLTTKLVDEARLTPLLVYVAGVEAVDSALDRIGPGTVEVEYTLGGRGLPRTLTRKNVFLSTQDVAALAPWEAALVLEVLAYNEFRDPGFSSLRLTARVEPTFRAVEILDLATDKRSYRPGETVEFTLLVRHWRGEVQAFEGSIQIPRELRSPYVELRAYGGPRLREKGEPPKVFESLADLLDYIEDIPTYDTLTVELFGIHPISDFVGEPWLFGVDSVSTQFPGAVVYGRRSLILPLEG